MSKGDYKDFIQALGARESGNKYDCENAYGFLGRWQFGKPRLYDAGYSLDNWSPKFRPKERLISKQYFLDNVGNIQDKVMLWHVWNLLEQIEKKYSDYYGKKINGITITLSGLIAGAHLKGMGGVKQFLKGKDNADALGTKISEYIKKFGGYNLSPNAKPKPLEEIKNA